jgi:hypothetical protein
MEVTRSFETAVNFHGTIPELFTSAAVRTSDPTVVRGMNHVQVHCVVLYI